MTKSKKTVSIVGAGLAGSEAAWQLAEMGYAVSLFEMRPKQLTPAHKSGHCAEIVCSNSFGSMAEVSAPGQLKWEAAELNSFILACGKEMSVPAGQALGLDREKFAAHVDAKIRNHKNIKIVEEVVKNIEDIPRPAIICTGPLTAPELAESMLKHLGQDFLFFFDAIAPIIDADSINTEIAWKADRWDKGNADYYNCPMNKEEYYNFINEIIKAEKTEPKDFEKDIPYFESCMPIEEMVARGPETLRFGPMKPVGLTDPRTGRFPYAAVQLRQDNKEATAYNMVGFQTKMKYFEQKRIFKMIPGLENAEFLKLGSIHKNLYIHTPSRLNTDLSSKNDPWLFFAGQITGVEGYFESTCIGLLVARFLDQKLSDKTFSPPPRESALGSLLNAITENFEKKFSPTNINFGLFPPLEGKINKKDKKQIQIDRAKQKLMAWKNNLL